MIKKVTVNFPEFGTNGLTLEHKFNKGINIIEEQNGYGKSTLLNTIMSAFTFKYPGMRTLPNGTASIETDKEKFILSKNNWIGTTHELSDLYSYCIPGKFFELKSTTDQRKVLIDLLELDYNKYMQEQCDKVKGQFTYLEWSVDLESKLKDKMKEFEANSNVIAGDIQRLQSEIINFETKEFLDIERYNQDSKVIVDKVREYNRSIITTQTDYNNLTTQINSINNKLSNYQNDITRLTNSNIDLEKQLKTLRVEYSHTNTKAVCDKCGSELQGEQKDVVLIGLQQLASKLKQSIDTNKNSIEDIMRLKDETIKELNTLNKQRDSFNTDFKVLSIDNLIEAATVLDLDIVNPSPERLKEYEEYKLLVAKNERTATELKYKEDNIKLINTLLLDKSIDKFKEIKTGFTTKLEEATASLPLDIELFETLKNGNVKETFTIKYQGQDYYDLSTGNKCIVNIMLSKLFIDKLGLDFILIDEGGLIGKSNIDYIKELSKDYQIIIAKATGWTSEDFK